MDMLRVTVSMEQSLRSEIVPVHVRFQRHAGTASDTARASRLKAGLQMTEDGARPCSFTAPAFPAS